MVVLRHGQGRAEHAERQDGYRTQRPEGEQPGMTCHRHDRASAGLVMTPGMFAILVTLCMVSLRFPAAHS